MSRLRHIKLMDDLHRNFSHGPSFGIHQHIGLAVEWFPNRKKLLDFGKGIGFIQQRAVVVTADAFVNGLGRSPKAHHQGMSFETVQICLVGRETAAGRNHRLFSVRELPDDESLQLTKSSFPVLLKNLANGFVRTEFNNLIGIQIGEMQKLCNQPTYGRFSRAHEADQRQIVDGTRAGHRTQIPNAEAFGTQFLPDGPKSKAEIRIGPRTTHEGNGDPRSLFILDQNQVEDLRSQFLGPFNTVFHAPNKVALYLS
jgi:hypothetical protein